MEHSVDTRYKVRPYERDEAEYIAGICREMVDDGVLKLLGYSARKVEAWLLSVHANPRTFFQRIIVDETDTPIGLFVFHRCVPFYAESALGVDAVIFIEKRFRGRCMKQLQAVLNQFVQWCNTNDCKVKLIGSSTGIDPDTTERVFEFLGFKRIGTVHAYVGE